MDVGMMTSEEKTHFLDDHEPTADEDYTKTQGDNRGASASSSGLQKLQEEQNAPRNRCRFSENERPRNVIAFWILGLLNNYGYVVMLSAAKDIDENKAGLVLLADIVPTVLIKVTAPFWVHYLSYRLRIALCGLSKIASFYVVASTPYLGLKLMGVVLASIGAGWGEVTFLAYSAFYDKAVITYWSSGTGFAGIAGAGWYLLFRNIFDVSPRITLELCGIFPVLYVLTFFLLLTKSPMLMKAQETAALSDSVADPAHPHGKESFEVESQNLLRSTGEHKIAESKELWRPEEEGGTYGDDNSDELGNKVHSYTSNMTLEERVKAIVPLYKYMVPLCVVYFAEYLINTGVNSEVSFCGGMNTNEFYVYASFVYQVGVFLSRSSGSVIRFQKLWLLPILQMATLVYFIIQAMTNLIPVVEVVLLLVLWEGLLGGACYVNAFRRIAEDVSAELKEFSLGVASIADSFGIALASLVAIGIESGLKNFRHDHGLPCHGGVSS
eukprot:gb/GECG01009462.1/.p1 GENE.gb/GECG01009462.1/~~gb/GECG01009462.1/.p1  ORF type:complete len:496 (+),score=44.55 gb/GECG01009462.1/:1-1488(+)